MSGTLTTTLTNGDQTFAASAASGLVGQHVFILGSPGNWADPVARGVVTDAEVASDGTGVTITVDVGKTVPGVDVEVTDEAGWGANTVTVDTTGPVIYMRNLTLWAPSTHGAEHKNFPGASWADSKEDR